MKPPVVDGPIAVFAGARAPVAGLAWHGDSHLVMATSLESGYRIAEVDSPTTISTVALPAKVRSLGLLAGDRYAAICDDALLRVGELASGALIASTPVSTATYCLAASRDRERLYWAGIEVGHDRFAMAWSLATPPVMAFDQVHTFEPHACFAEGSREEIWTFLEWDVVIFDGRSGRLIAHHEQSRSECVGDGFVSLDGTHAIGLVCWLNRDDEPIWPRLRCWDPASGEIRWQVFEVHHGVVEPAPDKRWFVHAGRTDVTLYTSDDGCRMGQLTLDPVHGWVQTLRVSPDGRRLAVGTERGVVLVYDVPPLVKERRPAQRSG